MQELKLGIYEHFKGKRYQVLGTGLHSETQEELVIYKALYESKDFPKDQIWIRPKSMFLETVEHNGQQIPRFKFIAENI